MRRTDFSGDRQAARAVRICRNLLVIAPLCAILAGCGGSGNSNGAAGGEVRIDGAPVPRGYITFTPAGRDRGPVVGAPIENGMYRCEHVPVGKLTVTFVAQAAESTTVFDVTTNTKHQIPKDILPPAYSAGIPTEIAPGDNHRDFDLKSGGK